MSLQSVRSTSESPDLISRSLKGSASDTTSSQTSSRKCSAPQPDYSPSAGDVVEFEYKDGNTMQGLVGPVYTGATVVWSFHSRKYVTWHSLGDYKYTKITSISIPSDVDEVKDIAKAYFSKPVFKVGDRVKVVRKIDTDEWATWVDDMDDCIGKVFTVSGFSIEKRPKLKEMQNWLFPVESLVLAEPVFEGSYEQRQKQAVEHYGWKVSSMVKVVRKFDAKEDGWNKFSWNFSDKKASMQNKIWPIGKIRDDGIILNDNLFPYFALEPVPAEEIDDDDDLCW